MMIAVIICCLWHGLRADGETHLLGKLTRGGEHNDSGQAAPLVAVYRVVC